MSPIEILAAIFAVMVLTKIVVFLLFFPKKWKEFAQVLLKKPMLLAVIYSVLAVVVGKYVLESMSAAQLAAAMLFSFLLLGVSMVIYSKALLKIAGETIKERKGLILVMMLFWAAGALWVLYNIFWVKI